MSAARQYTLAFVSFVSACSETAGDGAPPDTGTPAPETDVADAAAERDAGDAAVRDGGALHPEVEGITHPITAKDVALIVNTDDPQSVAVAAHYAQKRGLPAGNVIALSLGADWATKKTKKMPSATFSAWKAQIDAATPAGVQAYAVTFIYPSIVDCMSLTSALAFGFDAKWCSTPCNPTARSPYFSSTSSTPFTTHKMRPAMVLASSDLAGAKALIERGIASDFTFPLARGYLMRTTDTARSVRYSDFVGLNRSWNKPNSLAFTYIDNAAGSGTNVLTGKTDVLFYFTGLPNVADIATNTYVPGGIADHLTSVGGQIPDSPQMSILRWIEAGATGSYGTVVEPCAYPDKFPRASLFLAHYFDGETLIEAYWKSVAWPGEGLFIGEPLARPYGTKASVAGGTLQIRTTELTPGKSFRVEGGPSRDGPWVTVKAGLTAPHRMLSTITIPAPFEAHYRLVTP